MSGIMFWLNQRRLKDLEKENKELRETVTHLRGYERAVDAYAKATNKLQERNAALERLLVDDIRRHLQTTNTRIANRLVREIEATVSKDAKRWIGLES